MIVQGCGSAPSAARQIVTLGDWNGNGIRQTDTFTTSTREWRLRWTASNEAMRGASILQIMVHDAGTDALVTLAANQQGVGSGDSVVRAPAGDYYLSINSGNVDWTVRAEETR